MELYINTADNNYFKIALYKEKKLISESKIFARGKQAEKLLPAISRILNKSGYKLNKIKKIKVQSKGGSFTSLRIGVITANTLGYALNIPVESTDSKLLKQKGIIVVKPEYDREPNITVKKL